MIGYITLGTDDLNKSGNFYDTLLAAISAQRIMQADDFIAWGVDKNGPMFSIHLPADSNSASVGNGVMIALKVTNKDKVDAFYQKALQLGATDEGKPGYRAPGFYAAYFRDLDGNKLNVHSLEE